MYQKFLIPLLLFTIFTVACGNTNENTQDTEDNLNTQPMHYETEGEQANRLNKRGQTIGEQGGYRQSNQEGVNASDYSGGYSDPYTNEETERLATELKNRNDIVQAQVTTLDDRVVVAVKLKEKYVNPNITESLEIDISEMMPDKEIVLYTDQVYWEQRKNLNARSGSEENYYDVEDYITDFFHRND